MTENNNSNISGNVQDGYEKSDAKAGRLLVMAVVSILCVVIIVVFVSEFFIFESENIIQTAALEPESLKLREIRAHSENVLNSYGVVDEEKGIYRIPIERAIHLSAEESFKNSQLNQNP